MDGVDGMDGMGWDGMGWDGWMGCGLLVTPHAVWMQKKFRVRVRLGSI